MTDFKTGDVVTFVMPDFAPWQGGKGTILKKGVDGSKPSYYVEVTEVPPANLSIRIGHTAWLYPGWLELVKPEPKFKVGDWVEITGWGGSWEGQVLQIDSLPKPGSICYHLAGGGGFSDEYLKAAEAPKPAAKTEDMVNGPSHYGGADNPYEAIKVAEAWGFEKNAYLFNALKYLARAEHKGKKVEDLKKLQFYVAREIALEEAK